MGIAWHDARWLARGVLRAQSDPCPGKFLLGGLAVGVFEPDLEPIGAFEARGMPDVQGVRVDVELHTFGGLDVPVEELAEKLRRRLLLKGRRFTLHGVILQKSKQVTASGDRKGAKCDIDRP